MPEDAIEHSIDLGDIAFRLIAAVVVGILIGIDREWRNKPVGVRTLALVSLGAALVCLTTVHLRALDNHPEAIARVVSGVIEGVMTGIGFIGAGAVIQRSREVEGLTTAATVWVTAALGIACALATWEVVAVGVGLTLVVLVLLHPLDFIIDRRRAGSGAAGQAKPADARSKAD
jgi:putative Mg2+ transporter-C (MgtC) family protein